jgi:multidrug transporter EmrE-like cation transporter
MSSYAINVALFAAYVASSTVGLLMLKGALSRIQSAGSTIFSPSPDALSLWAGFGLYVVSFAIWVRILSRMPLSTAYPVAIGLTLTFSTAGAALLLGERLSVLKIAGILLIFAGLLALSLERK